MVTGAEYGDTRAGRERGCVERIIGRELGVSAEKIAVLLDVAVVVVVLTVGEAEADWDGGSGGAQESDDEGEEGEGSGFRTRDRSLLHGAERDIHKVAGRERERESRLFK